MMINSNAPKYLPNKICQVLSGLVFRISMVPKRISSLKLRIVIAGIKKIKNHGVIKKKLFRSAKPAFNILRSPLKTHKKNPFINKKTKITR